VIVFPVAVLAVFLVLASLYESWTLPLAVILIVPACICSALFGVWLTAGDNNVFVQMGLVVLMGPLAKPRSYLLSLRANWKGGRAGRRDR
jgi:multidrug efflux pump